MRAIEAENKTLKNVLPKKYASPDLDKRVLGDVVDLFTNNMNMDDIQRKAKTCLVVHMNIALHNLRLMKAQKAANSTHRQVSLKR
jgi:hypothetical protein